MADGGPGEGLFLPDGLIQPQTIITTTEGSEVKLSALMWS